MIQEIIQSKDPKQIKALFAFNKDNDNASIVFKFNLWARYFFANYFTSPDADFHREIDLLNCQAYKGEIKAFVDIAFRGAAKTARTKLFVAYCIANDIDHFRRYIKVLSEDGNNSKQIVTDIYNMMVSKGVKQMYPEIFEKTTAKREETMQSFTTSTGVKILADTVGTDQRGAIQEDARPDLIWYEDFENRTTLRSGKKTKSIWENMEEARTGLAKNGSSIYTCNYISEQGNVHVLVTKPSTGKVVKIYPIIDDYGKPLWDRYTIDEIEQMRQDDDDFEGERLCKPSASKDVLFDRETLDRQVIKQPIKVSAGFKVYKEFNPSHRYGSGHDVAGGVGLDSSTSCFIDFDTVPAQVVGTFHNNGIRPDVFGDEINRQHDIFGGCLVGIETNNHGHATIARARQLGVNLYKRQAKDTKVNGAIPTEYGWNTNALTKPKMLFALAKAVEDGLLELNDPDLVAECKSYTRNDLIDDEKDPRLTTRHFDLLIAAAIAWQMKDFARVTTPDTSEPIIESEPIYSDIGI
jgi:hypothetical protein